MDLSVIVPLYNEEQNVGMLCANIHAALDPLNCQYEIILVDDGSQDTTFAVAEALCRDDDKLRLIKFRRNYGQTPAMAAGIEHAQGDVLVTMDGDLQNDPTDIPAFLQKIEEGYDIVVGWRHNRQDKLVTRKVPSVIANWLIGKVTGVPIKDNGCSLKAYRAELIKSVRLYSEMHRFIPAMTSIAGARIAELKVKHHARRFGTSKYGLSRIYKVLLDLLAIKTITSFASRPMLWFAMIAFPAALLCLALLPLGMYKILTSIDPAGLNLAATGALFGVLAINLLLSGALGELVYKTGDIRAHTFSSITEKIFLPNRGAR